MNPPGQATVTILGFAALATATSLLVGWLGGDGSLREWLLSCAGALELWGLLLVASPELVPYARRLATGLGALWRRTMALAPSGGRLGAGEDRTPAHAGSAPPGLRLRRGL